MFGRRRKWNSEVAALLPIFGTNIDEAGVFKSLEALDIVCSRGFTKHEAAYYLAHLVYVGMLKRKYGGARIVGARIKIVESEWLTMSNLRPDFVDAYRQKRTEWQTQFAVSEK